MIVGSSARPQSRIRSLDALRGLAAVSVVIYYYTFGFDQMVTPHRPPLPEFVYGHLGVNLFFVISGFVILRTLERCTRVSDFAISRFARLYPAFIVAMCVTLLTMGTFDFNPLGIGVGDVLASAIYGSDLLGVHYVDQSYWTLGFEVVFYALAGFCCLILRMRRIELVCLVWMAIGLACVTLHRQRLVILTEGEWSFLFVLGMMAHVVGQSRATMLTWLTVGVALVVCAYLGGPAPSNLSATFAALLNATFFAIVLAAGTGRVRFLGIWPLLFLGDISYSLYLIHQVAGLAVMRWFEEAGIASPVAVGLTVLIAIIVASALRYGVEIPAQVLIKRVGRRVLHIPEHVSTPPGTIDRSA